MQSRWPRSRRGLRPAIPYLLLVLLLLGGGLAVVLSIGSTNSHAGPEGVPILSVPDLASSTTTLTGTSVDGISCRTEAKETVKYHIHVHVSIYVNASQLRLPAGIGITKPQLVEHYAKGVFDDVGLYDCLYWLHTHVADDVIHMEASAKGNFTLGQFFDIWDQPLNSTQVGPDRGPVVVFEAGRRLSGDPRATPLLPHAIELDVGSSAVPLQPFSFKVTGGCGQGTNSCKVSKT